MADISSIFILLAVLSGNSDSVSMMELATFDSMETCQKAAASFQTSLSEGTRVADLGCVPASVFSALRGK